MIPRDYSPSFTTELVYDIYPNSSEIRTIIDVAYSAAEGEYHYILIYDGSFVFENDDNITIFVPLPSGSVKYLVIEVNDEELRPVNIRSNQVIVPLGTADGPQTLNVSYRALGTGHYRHYVPKDVFLERFRMEITIKNVGYDEFIPEDCLSPDEFRTSREYAYFRWDGDRAVLRKDISLDISTPDEIKTVQKEVPWNMLLWMGVMLTVLAGVSVAFYWHVLTRMGRRIRFHAVFLFVPHVTMFMLFGILMQYTSVHIAAGVSAGAMLGLMLLVLKKTIGIRKGLAIAYSIPALLLTFGTGLLLFPGRDHIIFVAMPLLAAAFIYLHFLDTHRMKRTIKRKIKRVSVKA